MTIDLRSDTLTQPSEEMLEYMAAAQVGDDVFGEDPTVNKLERLAANIFNKEAGLFCPSGTMSNQIAIKAQTQPGSEIICDANAHIYYYEGGGIAFNSGCTTKTLNGNRGVFSARQLLEALRPSDVHFPNTALVSVENTCNRGGGKVFNFEEIQEIRQICLSNNLKMHLDGARLFNALVASKIDPIDMGRNFDTISICLSKGLGAPVGSVLLGSSEIISKARRIRKVLGGGMRQAGYLAAAGIFALENNVARLAEDHKAAVKIQSILGSCNYVAGVQPVETNIVVFELEERVDVQGFLDYLSNAGILAFQVGPNYVRFVTHLDLPVNALSELSKVLTCYSP